MKRAWGLNICISKWRLLTGGYFEISAIARVHGGRNASFPHEICRWCESKICYLRATPILKQLLAVHWCQIYNRISHIYKYNRYFRGNLFGLEVHTALFEYACANWSRDKKIELFAAPLVAKFTGFLFHIWNRSPCIFNACKGYMFTAITHACIDHSVGQVPVLCTWRSMRNTRCYRGSRNGAHTGYAKATRLTLFVNVDFSYQWLWNSTKPGRGPSPRCQMPVNWRTPPIHRLMDAHRLTGAKTTDAIFCVKFASFEEFEQSILPT